ncbi:MAG: histidine kinase [Lentimicrobium sp.]|jgi:signal transduction histidine kinase|nr:histidine kinase [Lentimicrobium sp.]
MRFFHIIIFVMFAMVNMAKASIIQPINADSCMHYLRSGDTLKARLCIDALFLQLNRSEPSPEEANTYRIAANFYVEKGNFSKAVLYYDSAYSVAHKLDESDQKRLLAQIRFNHSMLFYRFGEYNEALNLCLDAYQYYRLNRDASGIAETANRLGGLYLILGDSAKSAAFNHQAYAESMQSKDTRIKQLCLIAYGNYLRAQGKADSAIIIFNQSIEQAIATGNPKMVSDACYNLSYTYSNLEQYEKALELIKVAHTWAIKSGNAYDICDTRYKTGLVLYYMQRYQPAADTLLKALEEAQVLHSAVLQRNVYDVLSCLEADRDNPAKALEYLDLYIDFHQQVLTADEQRQLNFLNARYDAEKRESEILRQQAELQRRNFILALTLLALLALGIVIVMLVLLGRRKRKIAHQQLTIHQQKISELEKEKEIISMQSLLRGEESERGRIARDLHDGLGGMLSGVKLTLNNMTGKHTLGDDDVSKFEKAINLIDQSVKELRNVAHNMMPEILMQQGLDTALTNFCESLPSPPKIEYRFFGTPQRYENGFELTVYRITQELVNNALKHARAGEVVVELIQQDNRLSINVRDDGKGFDTSKHDTGHGLLNLRSRVAGYQGIIDISTVIGEGTEINVSFEDIEHLIKHD